MRVLAVASRQNVELEHAERDLTFLGLIGMIDPPRPEAKEAIAKCKQAGIHVVMITGDHPVTARAVAGELGLLSTDRVVTGKELDGLTDKDLEQQVQQIECYARVSPAHKLRVVTALQERGEIVAMTGDGVNDAPALKKAAIGIAIAGGQAGAFLSLAGDQYAPLASTVAGAGGIFLAIFVLLGGLFYFVLLYALGEMIALQIAIEENTRLTAALLLKMHQDSLVDTRPAYPGAFATEPAPYK